MGKNLSKTLLYTKHRLECGVGMGIGVIGLIMIAMLFPIYPESANAEGEVTGGTLARASVQAIPVLSVGLTDIASLDIAPTTAGTIGSSTATLTINTNSSSGYSVFLRTENGESTLKNALGDTGNAAIKAVSGTPILSEFDKNTWGYTLGKDIDLGTATFRAVPTNAETSVLEVDSFASGTASDSYTLAFGAKIDTSIPSGEYTNSVVVSAIAKPMPPNALATITKMQEMTAAICEDTYTGASNILTDTRNGKQYTVFKAKDDNCWMRTNLAISGAVPKAKVTGGTDGTFTPTKGVNYWEGDVAVASGGAYKTEYGFYYNYAAATAGTGPTSSGGNASASVCPTGDESDANWVLPKSSGAGSFANLFTQSGGQNASVGRGELGFIYGGYVEAGSLKGAGNDSSTYWSRTSAGSVTAYNLFMTWQVFPAYGNDRSIGRTLRCLYPSTSTKASVLAQ